MRKLKNTDNMITLGNSTNGILTMITVEKKEPSQSEPKVHYDIIGRVVPEGEDNSSFYDVLTLRVIVEDQTLSTRSSSCLNQNILFKQIECLNDIKYVAEQILNNVDYQTITLENIVN